MQKWARNLTREKNCPISNQNLQTITKHSPLPGCKVSPAWILSGVTPVEHCICINTRWATTRVALYQNNRAPNIKYSRGMFIRKTHGWFWLLSRLIKIVTLTADLHTFILMSVLRTKRNITLYVFADFVIRRDDAMSYLCKERSIFFYHSWLCRVKVVGSHFNVLHFLTVR